MADNRWLPLESNPEIMNKYISQLGVDTTKWQFTDIFSFDSESLSFIPKPVVAVLLLFPITPQSESKMIGEQTKVGESGDNVYFMKQTISNACGTIGIIHALCNNAEELGFDSEKHLGKFLLESKGLSPSEKAKLLETNPAFVEVHEEVANEGQTKVPDRNERVDLHFVAFVHRDGVLYELDGRKDGPVKHGKSSQDSLLEDSVKVVKKFMERDPSQISFTVVALAKA